MIYTVTFNPAIDYVVRMDGDLLPGMTNRSVSEECYYGGKGINVSMVLSELGQKSTALGFVAGFTGRAIDEAVRQAGIDSEFITLKDGLSRINVKLKATEETEINAQGPKIDEASQKALFDKLSKLKEGDVLILAGSIPNSLPDDVYEKILSMLQGRGIEFVVDATKDLLKNVLKYHPFLIKPNNFELGEIIGKTLTTDDEIYEGALELQKLGARNVLISMAADGAVLVDETGKKYRIGVPKGKVRNSVGAGDSMVAGFVAGYMKTGDYDTALKMGTAAGSATAFSDGLAKAVDIEKLFKSL
ncbi:MAG: 1-phosphofructokinase [Pseudobutyrivibrio sp.]|nr:1-phosphofructokinase [Pseudobutyrivibrio sp.]